MNDTISEVHEPITNTTTAPTPSSLPTKAETTLVVRAAASSDPNVDGAAVKKLVSVEAPGAAALAAEEATRVARERADERVAALLADARTLAGRGDYEMAIRLAREAAHVLPDATGPHSALAIYAEKLGRKSDVIAALEMVVALNPDSTADRLKLAQLRGAASPSTSADSVRIETTAVRRTGIVPVALGGVAAVVVLGIGLAVFANRTNSTGSGGDRAASTNTSARASLPVAPSASVVERNAAARVTQGYLPPPAAPNVPLPPTPIDVRTQPLPSPLPDQGTTSPARPSRRRVVSSENGDALPNFGQKSVTTTQDAGSGVPSSPTANPPASFPGVGRILSNSGVPLAPSPRSRTNLGNTLPLPGASSGGANRRPVLSGTTTAPNPTPATQVQPPRRPFIRIEVKSGPPAETAPNSDPNGGSENNGEPAAPPPPVLPPQPPQESDSL